MSAPQGFRLIVEQPIHLHECPVFQDHLSQPRTADLPCISYSIPNAAKVLDVPETKLWQAVKDKQLRSFKVGRSRRVSHEALCEYVEALERQLGELE
jgi:excisionase family DNA binding protein